MAFVNSQMKGHSSLLQGTTTTSGLLFVLSVGRGTFLTAVSLVFPTLMLRAAVQIRKWQAQAEGSSVEEELKQQSNLIANLALLFMMISIAIGVTGVSISLSNICHRH